MTNTLTLTAKKRVPSRQTNRELKENRQVLGVVYGHGFDPVPVSVDASDILRAFRKVGTSTLINLDIEGKKAVVLMKEVSLHPVRHEIDHVDFFVANLKEKAVVHVPLEFVNESPAVKLGGVLMTAHKHLDIKCLPADSPRKIEVDLSLLKTLDDVIKISDLGLDAKKYEVVGLSDDEVVCSVKAKRVSIEKEDTEGEGETGESTEEEKKAE